MIDKLSSLASRVLFVAAFVSVGIALWEKLVNLFGFTILQNYPPWRFFEVAGVALLFVIALQLREIKLSRAGGL